MQYKLNKYSVSVIVCVLSIVMWFPLFYKSGYNDSNTDMFFIGLFTLFVYSIFTTLMFLIQSLRNKPRWFSFKMILVLWLGVVAMVAGIIVYVLANFTCPSC